MAWIVAIVAIVIAVIVIAVIVIVIAVATIAPYCCNMDCFCEEQRRLPRCIHGGGLVVRRAHQ